MNYSQINARLPFLHLTASKDPFRAPMQFIQVKTFEEPGTYGPAGIYATATDAHTLVTCNLADYIGNLENVPGPEILIKADQFKKLTGTKAAYLDFTQPGQIVTRDKAGQQIDAIPYLRPEDPNAPGKYPEWPAVLPTADPDPTAQIAIHPEKLGKICDILNAGGLNFEMRGPTRAIIARYTIPENHGTALGLVMPLYSDFDNLKKVRTETEEKNAQAYQQAKERRERTEGKTA